MLDLLLYIMFATSNKQGRKDFQLAYQMFALSTHFILTTCPRQYSSQLLSQVHAPLHSEAGACMHFVG
jgi:hypothetical protein